MDVLDLGLVHLHLGPTWGGPTLAALGEPHVPLLRQRHRIIYRYSEIAAACCINTGILQEIQVYIQDLYRYNRNNNIFDTVYENRHITMSSHYLEPEIHKYSDKCRIFTQVMIQKFSDHVTRYK